MARIVERVVLRWSGVALFLVLWETAPKLGWVDPQFAPPFSAVFRAAEELAVDGILLEHTVISLWRAAVALLAAVAVGTPAGFFLGLRMPEWSTVLDPYLRVLSQVNPFSLMPVFVFFFGLGETAKIIVIAWVSLWPVLFYTITAVRNVDPILIKTARSFGITTKDLYLKIILPASLPVIFVGLRVGAGLVFFMIVGAEMLGANAGVGWLIHNSAMNYLIPRMYAGSAVIIILGYLLNRLLLLVERVIFVEKEDLSELAAMPRPSLLPSWRPGWKSAVVGATAVFLFIVGGGIEVYQANARSASLDGYIGQQGEGGSEADGLERKLKSCCKPKSARKSGTFSSSGGF